jgi:hypothetical protein
MRLNLEKETDRAIVVLVLSTLALVASFAALLTF